MATSYFRTRRLISLCFLKRRSQFLFSQTAGRSYSSGYSVPLIRRTDNKWAWPLLIGAVVGGSYFYKKQRNERNEVKLFASEEEKKDGVKVRHNYDRKKADVKALCSREIDASYRSFKFLCRFQFA